MKDAFLSGAGVTFTGGISGSVVIFFDDDEGLQVALGTEVHFRKQEEGEENWFFHSSQPNNLRALGRAIIAAGDALEELQTEEGQ